MHDFRTLAALCEKAGCRFLYDEPMSRHVSFCIGGPADFAAFPKDEETLAALLSAARAEGIPARVIGCGSNLLVEDAGIRGAVLILGAAFSALRALGDTAFFAQSGAKLSELCRYAQRQGLTGLEFAYGIPGALGGAVYMNAGAFDGEMSQVTERIRFLNDGLAIEECDRAQAGFSYRKSVFQQNGRIITGAYLQLKKAEPAAVLARMQELFARRCEKQPLDYPSAGSTFKRPLGAYTGALIEGCGLKGKRIGGAMVSEKHAGFLVNAGGASAADMLALIELVQETVLRETGFQLECEIERVGERRG